MNDVFPEAKCTIRRMSGRFYIVIHENTDLVLIGFKEHESSDFRVSSNIIIRINIFPEHSVYEFLYSIFEKYSEDYTISISPDDIDDIVNKLTRENYENYLLELNTKKYNL